MENKNNDQKHDQKQKKRRFFRKPRNVDYKNTQLTPEEHDINVMKERVNTPHKTEISHGDIKEQRRKASKAADKTLRNLYSKRVEASKLTKLFSKSEAQWKPLRIIPIGGLEEVGGNSMIVEHEDDMIIVDVGMLFGNDNLPGIDYVAPDLKYAEANKNRLKAVVISHGHLDHIGALAHTIERLGFPKIYAPKFAIGLMKRSFEEKGMWNKIQHKVHEYKQGDILKIASFTIEPYQVDHSIPDAFGLFIQTKAANFVHSGDFFMDMEKVETNHPWIEKMHNISKKGVDLFMSDSTNALVPGHVTPEIEIEKNIEQVVRECEGRVILTMFSSNITRIQGVINVAKKTGRKVYLNGRSILNNAILAKELGYLNYTEGDVKRLTKHMGRIPDNKVLIVTTGSQGEQYAGLTRMAMGAHPVVKIKEKDTIIHSARMIPGNNDNLLNVINTIIRKGARFLFKFNTDLKLHTSGHAYRGDLEAAMRILNPVHVAPLHGELFMRKEHQVLAMEMGIPKERAHLIENGDALEIANKEVRIISNAVPLDDIVVENGFEGDMSDPVISERLTMRENGVIVVTLKVDKATRHLNSSPKIITRGFVFKNLSQEWNKALSQTVKKEYEKLLAKVNKQKKQKELIAMLRSNLARYIVTKYEKTPIILPIFIEE